MSKLNGYDLSRKWFDFRYENPSKCRAAHSELYLFIVDLWNRLGQKKEFGLPTINTMELLGIGSRNTYYKVLQDIETWGFIRTVQSSTNQHHSRIIAILKNEQATSQALDRANMQASIQANEQATSQALDHIDKQQTSKQINNKQERRFTPPSLLEVQDYFYLKLQPNDKSISDYEAEKFIDFYTSKNWMIGKNKMKDWQAAVRTWINRNKNQSNEKSNNSKGRNYDTKTTPEEFERFVNSL